MDDDEVDYLTCDVCNVKIRTHSMYKIHLTTSQHRKKEDALIAIGKARRRWEMPEWTSYLEYLDYLQLDEPIIGLNHLVELHPQPGAKATRLLCKLCRYEADVPDMTNHIVGRKHRQKHLETQRRDLVTWDLANVSQLGKVVRAKAEVAERQDGRGVPQELKKKPEAKVKMSALKVPSMMQKSALLRGSVQQVGQRLPGAVHLHVTAHLGDGPRAAAPGRCPTSAAYQRPWPSAWRGGAGRGREEPIPTGTPSSCLPVATATRWEGSGVYGYGESGRDERASYSRDFSEAERAGGQALTVGGAEWSGPPGAPAWGGSVRTGSTLTELPESFKRFLSGGAGKRGSSTSTTRENRFCQDPEPEPHRPVSSVTAQRDVDAESRKRLKLDLHAKVDSQGKGSRSDDVLDILKNIDIESVDEANFIKDKLCNLLKEFQANKAERDGAPSCLRIEILTKMFLARLPLIPRRGLLATAAVLTQNPPLSLTTRGCPASSWSAHVSRALTLLGNLLPLTLAAEMMVPLVPTCRTGRPVPGPVNHAERAKANVLTLRSLARVTFLSALRRGSLLDSAGVQI
ncbi:hypothetical protein AAFF_G00441380 [Aldrovandia affinis]|uniref:Uncharacterized protein n=1 Tax=Aldrovandia affinis TaxID=143900 RepID=A0AAD7WII9_9TELE|nr:hypothetical protein AAFF_G00441380 [Aldrovandia affinis]